MTRAFSWEEWARQSAVELVARVRRGDVTAAEVTAQAQQAALALEPDLGALVEVLEAPAAPHDVPLAPGVISEGLLAGLPLFLKDLGSSVAGLLRENGSALHRGERVARTDPLTAAWLREGARVLGRATTAELGMAYDTSTVYRGLQVTRNPWNLERTAGGSSGGSAALVAAGIVPVAHATDGAGSIRLPAAFNGLVGLKVSRGRLPPPWGANELSNTTWVEGVFARSLEDAALLLDAATRTQPPLGSHFVAPSHQPSRTLAALAEPRAEPLRVGFTTHAFGRSDACGSDAAAAVREVADALAGEHRVEELAAESLPSWDVLWPSFETFWAGIRAGSWRLRHGELSEQRLAELSPMVRGYWRASERYGKREVLAYLAANASITRSFGELFERYDVLLLPAFPYAVPLANGAFSPAVEHDFDAFVQRFLDGGRYTMPASEAGLPALTLPVGFDPDGLPRSVQLYGSFGGEAGLLRAGRVVENAISFAPRTPRVHASRLGERTLR